MTYPSNSDDFGGFYIPETLHYPPIPGYQSWVNSTEGKLSVQDKDAIYNLITQLPTLYAEGLGLAGETTIWLRRLTTGKKCQYFNENNDQCSVSKCTQCFETGILGGYENAVALKMSFTPGKSDILIEESGLTITTRPTAWTIITEPPIAEKDIVVSFANERWEVHTSESVEHQGRKHHQELTLSRIDKNDVKYYVNVPGVNGDEFNDFPCYLTIISSSGINQMNTQNTLIGVNQTMPGQNFLATITIKNYFFNPVDGITH